MPKVFVFKKPDGTLIYGFPSKKYQGGYIDPVLKRELTLEDYKIGGSAVGLPYIICEYDEIPHPSTKQGTYFEMLYIDGELAPANIRQDSAWERNLMPASLIKHKRIKKLTEQIDSELEKNKPDAVELMRSQREIEKVSQFKSTRDAKAIYEIALNSLDARVGGGESDKPLIREKLQQKLQELGE